jgi:hypothetical protein
LEPSQPATASTSIPPPQRISFIDFLPAWSPGLCHPADMSRNRHTSSVGNRPRSYRPHSSEAAARHVPTQ